MFVLDIAFVLLTLLFFIVAASYVSGCERIKWDAYDDRAFSRVAGSTRTAGLSARGATAPRALL